MWFWDTIKTWAKNLWNRITGNWQSDEQTNSPTTGSNFSKTLNQTINNWITIEDNSVDVPSKGILDDPEDLLWTKSWDALVEEEKRKENQGAREATWELAEDLWDFVDTRKKKEDVDWDYRTKKGVMAIWYNKDKNSVLRLAIDPLDEDNLEAYYRWYQRVVWDPSASEMDKYNAFLDFYNQAKGLFKVKWMDPVYSKRYNEDTLNKLYGNNVSAGAYIPSIDEFATYFDVEYTNEQKHNDMLKQAGVTTTNKDRTIIDLEADESNRWFSDWRLNSNWNIPELIKSRISSIDWAEGMEAMAHYEDVQSDQGSRIYQHVAPVYAKERVALSKSPSERNEWDWAIIAAAETMRKLEKQYWANLVNWMTQEIKNWVNEKWQIKDALDSFDNWENLNKVLTKWMREIAWMDANAAFAFRQSPIDIFEAVANDALYKYNQANIKDPIRRWWNSVEYAFHWLWVWLGELWQIINESAWEIFTLWTAKYTSYLNNDMSIGKLIETDDWKWKRNIKKYTLQWLEYAPEGLMNLAPDIAAVALSQWGTAPTLLTKLWKVWKVARWIERINNLEKTSSTIQKWLRWLDRLSEMSKSLSSVDAKWKLVANAIDRWVTQFALWQAIDGQWSVYDTEKYSTASYALSALWWVWLDFLPELTTLKGIIKKPLWSVRSLVDYIESSPEAAQNIAKVMWKDKPEFSMKEIEWYANTFWKIEEASKYVYNNVLNDAERASAWQWTKNMMYNYINQAYWANTTIAKNVRQILANGSLNPADIIKYVWWIPWEVSFWPWNSSIILKHWTEVWLTSTWPGGQYKAILDNLEWWFDRRLREWFTSEDIEKISTFDWFKDVLDKKSEYFFKLWDNYYLTDEWLKAFDLEKWNIPIESFWVTIAEAENVREILKERMKDLKWIQLTEKTINNLADWGWYNAVVDKVKEVLWC